ncbi:MAG: baseplate J/gp47 family protein [Cetobacterium sp.]
MYEKYTKKQIHDEMMEEIPNAYDKGLGSVMSDLILANSYIIENLYKNLDTEIKNSFISIADSEEDTEECENLERLAYERTFSLRKTHVKATGLLKVATIKETFLPKGTIFIRKDGIEYVSLEDLNLNINDSKHVFIECLEYGEIGNCPVGYIDKMKNEDDGILVNNDKPLTSGEDKEKKEVFRQRIQEYIFNPASSGNKSHYFKWLEEFTDNGIKMLGKVKVISRFDDLPYTIKIIMTDTNNQPITDNLISKVKNYIEDLRPEGALITYETAISKSINIKFKAVLNKGVMNDKVQEKCKNAINKYFSDMALDEDKNFININSIAGVLMCLDLFKNITELKINDDFLDVELQYNEVAFLNEFEMVV